MQEEAEILKSPEHSCALSSAGSDRHSSLCVVIPTYNEEANLPSLFAQLIPELELTKMDWHVVFVDDGSTDNSANTLAEKCLSDHRIKLITLSRNFGKELAIAAGLENAKADAVILMDADLQHPPELIHEFLKKWREGFRMVYGQRTDRKKESILRRLTAECFYSVFEKASGTSLPEGAGDFRLFDKSVVQSLNSMPERARFSKGLYSWVGYDSVGVRFQVGDRINGASGWKLKQLLSFAIDGITSFSKLPLRICTILGFIISGLAFFYAAVYLVKTIIFGIDLPGFSTIALSVTLLSGVQLVSLGIIGEYIGRIYEEVKGRPLYIVERKIGFTINEES